MKKLNTLVLGLIVAMGVSSCIKEGETYDPQAQFELEKPVVEAYALEHLDYPQFHENTGIWYEIVEPGDSESYQYKATTGSSGSLTPVIPQAVISYEGRLVSNNSVFEAKEDQEAIIAQNVIAAWQAAFYPETIRYDDEGESLDEPLEFGGLTADGLKAGSVIRIVTPSYWAYQNSSSGSIPANSPLYFQISVSEIEDYNAN